jgi:hypothetical protein
VAVDYLGAFLSILEPLKQQGGTISASDVFSSPLLGTAKHKTKMRHLKSFISQHPAYLGIVHGVLPSRGALLTLIQDQLGEPISETNVVAANRKCAEIVLKTARPVVESYIRTALGQYVAADGLNVPMTDLIEFLVGDYATFSRGAGNGLVSIAGGMNEELLEAALKASGMNVGVDFTRTGTDSDGDIVIHSHSGVKSNLGVEIKSYHARERLLRGLKDIEGPKVGAGYFIDPGEFGETRTVTLLQTHAAAIYMPAGTLSKLGNEARAAKSNETIAYGSKFYRPLERFASDMKAFSITGVLPKI